MAIDYGRFDGDWDRLERLLSLGFADPWNREQLDTERRAWERERSIVAAEDKELVGHTSAFSLRMAVPGAVTPVAGVTLVCVAQTHRRRGILRELMRRQLTELAEDGREPVAALTASEPVIYGRFGYGLASEGLEVAIPKTARTMRAVAGVDEIAVRYADIEESRELAIELHNRQLADRPGMVEFEDRWYHYATHENVITDPGGSPLRCVVSTRDGEPTGFAHFKTRRGPTGFVEVSRVHALDLPSHLALWKLLLDHDLLSETRYEHLPLDDPLLALLLDPRAPKARMVDALWVRLADVGRALAERRYTGEVDVVLDVVDEFLPWNAGRWRLTGDATGASCERTDRPADLRLDVRELGSVYLGRPSLARLGAAGLVEERTAGALAATSAAFDGARVPWLDTHF